MSELMMDSDKRKDILKNLIRSLHVNGTQEKVRKELEQLLGKVPYADVVKAEQELMNEGISQDEILKLCDIHSAVLKGNIEKPKIEAEPGHPVHTFLQENIAVTWEAASIQRILSNILETGSDFIINDILNELKLRLNSLSDIDKHYRRKENLLFPYLEKKGITGPSKVMWAKDDEARKFLKEARAELAADRKWGRDDLVTSVPIVQKAVDSVLEMIDKEESVLLPMSLDTLDAADWHEIYRQSSDIGFCLYDARIEWIPADMKHEDGADKKDEGRIRLPSGSMSVDELIKVLNILPVDMTFVDSTDTVRYFSESRDRIFDRSRAIVGRKIQLCHPPASVHVVEKILDDFKSGKQESAAFWINLGGRFIHIEYFALRGVNNEYLGTLEVSQDLTAKRKLTGEQRLLSYK